MKEAKFKVGDKVLYNHTLHTGRVFVITDMRYVYYPAGDDWEYTMYNETIDKAIKVFGGERLVSAERVIAYLTQNPTKKNKRHKNKEKLDLSHDNL